MYRQGGISKNDKFQTIGFHSSSSLKQFNSPKNRYVPLRGGNQVCAEAKTNRVSLVSPDLNTIEQLLDELSRRIQDRSVQYRNLRKLQVAITKNGRGFPTTLCCVTCFWFDLVMIQFVLHERVMSVFG